MDHHDNPFYQLAESSPDAIYIGAKGRFAYVNPAALRLFGVASPDCLLGQLVIERIHSNDRPAMGERIRRLYEHGESAPMLETHFLRVDGTAVDVEVSAVPFSYQGEPGCLVFARDISRRKQAEKALQGERLFLRQVIDACPNLIFVKDRTGTFLLANESVARAYGTTVAGLEGRTDADFNPNPEEAQAFRRADQEVMDSRCPKVIPEEPVTFADGSEHVYSTTKTPLFDDQGACNAILGVATDITKRKTQELELEVYRAQLEVLVTTRTAEARASETKFRSLVEQSLVGIFVIQAGRFRYVNLGFARIHGFADPAEIIGRIQPADLVAPRDRERVDSTTRRHLAESLPTSKMIFTGLRRDGSEVDLEASARALNYEGQPAVIGMVVDVTERKQAQLALEAHQTHLENLVAERTAALVTANAALQSFTYAASHDLRAPLGRIISFSRLLETRYQDRLDGEALLALDFIRQNATRMTVLIEDLMAHAQIEQKIRDCQPVNLRHALLAVLKEDEEDIRQAGAEIQMELPEAVVAANPHGLAQVLRNLLENALKYSAQSSPPVISIGASLDADVCRLWIRDNGIGFDMGYHDQIFEIFRRLHTYDEFPGSGVGLALVRKAMDSMGGRVWAQSEPGRGATFFLEFPLAAEPAPAD